MRKIRMGEKAIPLTPMTAQGIRNLQELKGTKQYTDCSDSNSGKRG
jgi:hypothetical protein